MPRRMVLSRNPWSIGACALLIVVTMSDQAKANPALPQTTGPIEVAEKPIARAAEVAPAPATYYAPQTPARMTPESTHSVEFVLTNTTAAVWPADDRVLTYRWTFPDGTDDDLDNDDLDVPDFLK